MKPQKQFPRNKQSQCHEQKYRYEQGITDTKLHELFGKLAELVDKVAESRHIETMEAYGIIDNIINRY